MFSQDYILLGALSDCDCIVRLLFLLYLVEIELLVLRDIITSSSSGATTGIELVLLVREQHLTLHIARAHLCVRGLRSVFVQISKGCQWKHLEALLRYLLQLSLI